MSTRSGILLAIACSVVAGCASAKPTAQNAAMGASTPSAIEGTASYRERMALPPSAEFEAVLQDVSRADAPAMEIGRAKIPNAPMPPIRFTIPYDAANIDPSHTYAVRAVIRVDGRLWFTSDTHYPVLTRGAGDTVDILMKRVP